MRHSICSTWPRPPPIWRHWESIQWCIRLSPPLTLFLPKPSLLPYLDLGNARSKDQQTQCMIARPDPTIFPRKKESVSQPSSSSQGVTAQYLLEGAAYALEQAGLLLHDAVLLYTNQRYASAIVLALFAREEVGRYKLLRELRKGMMENGRTVTVEDIEKECDDHVTKQLRGQSGVTIKSSGDDQVGKLLRTTHGSPLQSSEAREARTQLDAIVQQLHGKIPHQRHDLRQKSLYVGPSDSGTSWNRPKEQSNQTAREEIEGASNAYAGAFDRFTNAPAYRDEDPTFYDGLEAWREGPTMPRLVTLGFD